MSSSESSAIRKSFWLSAKIVFSIIFICWLHSLLKVHDASLTSSSLHGPPGTWTQLTSALWAFFWLMSLNWTCPLPSMACLMFCSQVPLLLDTLYLHHEWYPGLNALLKLCSHQGLNPLSSMSILKRPYERNPYARQRKLKPRSSKVEPIKIPLNCAQDWLS